MTGFTATIRAGLQSRRIYDEDCSAGMAESSKEHVFGKLPANRPNPLQPLKNVAELVVQPHHQDQLWAAKFSAARCGAGMSRSGHF